jgi:hypothetical protein
MLIRVTAGIKHENKTQTHPAGSVAAMIGDHRDEQNNTAS